MGGVQRYSLGYMDMDECEDGEWVRFAAYDALARKLEATSLNGHAEMERRVQLERQLAEATAKVDALDHECCTEALMQARADLAEAQQRIESLGQSLNAMDRINDRMMEPALRAEQAEARLAIRHGWKTLSSKELTDPEYIQAYIDGQRDSIDELIKYQKELKQRLAEVVAALERWKKAGDNMALFRRNPSFDYVLTDADRKQFVKEFEDAVTNLYNVAEAALAKERP